MPKSRVFALVLLVALPATVEAAVLEGAGLGGSVGLAPQLSAPSPFGVFHDLRWVLVYHDSWWSFGWQSALAIVARSLLNTGILALARADGLPGGWWPVLRLNLLFNLLVFVVLAPWAAIGVTASGTSLFWFVLGEVVPLVFLSLVLQRGGIVGDWWRRMPSLPEAGWAFVTFVVLTLGCVVVTTVPGWWRVVAAAVVAAVNAWLWRRLVVAASRVRRGLRFVPAAPIAILLSAGALLGMGQFSTIGGAVARRPPPRVDRLTSRGVAQQIVFVAGYDSVASTPAASPVYRFSYRGTAPDGKPLPYDKNATHQSLMDSASRLGRQVDAVHQRTGRSVALVAQSEGTLVVHAYLTRFAHPAVDAAVLLSPLVQPGRVYFPPPDRSGFGVATGWLLRGMFATIRATSGSTVRPDEPFVRSMLDKAPCYRGQMLEPVPGVREIAFLPFAGAAVVSPDFRGGIPVVKLPAVHAALLGDDDVQQRIVAFLQGRPAGKQPGLDYGLIERAGAAWQVPPLAPELNPVWTAARASCLEQ
ncbi:hypothetical protein HFP15_15665 [Amycolatopsis sp. K13G38]|uniref:Alpha/beta hydrolase n=1 Tax=Amycolatopsis acididurans TaxID=2724524 RepID=A0ABX1J3H8_9PSEU|nr:hypothetical protein [Amycolatopsis acididurans]NKQ54323.1 hypothetical protein [Amycolatopsis acididurans]